MHKEKLKHFLYHGDTRKMSEDLKCKLVCKKEGCKYEQDFTGYSKQQALDWMENWIKEHRDDMQCIHDCEVIDLK